MIYTGVDGDKVISVDWSPLRREWKLSKKQGRRIFVVPSHLTYVKKEKTEIGDVYDLRKALSVEIEEKFGEVLWDVKLMGDTYCLALIKEFELPDNAFALDPEPFSLFRVCKAIGEENCFVLDIGRRKTTLVDVSGGEFEGCRVSLKGGEFIDHYVSEKANLSKEEAENLKKREGLRSDIVREAFERIISSLGRDLSDKRVLLSGGGSRLVGIEDYFGEVIRNEFVPPEMSSAFGAALKYILPDCSPDFRGEELSERDLRKVVALFGISLLIFLGSSVGLEQMEKVILRKVRESERAEFKRIFPNLPAVAVREQVKSIAGKKEYELTWKLLLLSEKLKEGVKIYRIEYTNGILKVVGEAKNRDILNPLNPKSVKETPEGGYEFEVEL